MKPPHTPAFRKSTSLGSGAARFRASAVTAPMRKEPIRLMASVRTGKPQSLPRGIRPAR